MDKYKIAFISGVLSGVIMDIVDLMSFLILKAMKITHYLYADYMVAALLQGERSQNTFELVSGQFFHFIFTGTIGCIYIFVLASIREKNSYFKGWLIGGIGVWFTAFMIGVLYDIKIFVQAEMPTVISDFTTASLYGLFLSYFYRLFEKKYQSLK